MSGDFNGNGNGHSNGNGHNKGIFDLAPKQDPLLAQIVPAARRRVCLNTRICEAARMFYCYLTDCSLLPGVNSRKGVVKFSDQDLGMRFKKNAKTIRNWKRALESTGEVWLTEKFMKNSFPQTVYNITAIVGQATLPLNSDSEDGSLCEDEVFSSNRRRQRTVLHDPATGKFIRRLTPPGVPAVVSPEATVQISSKSDPSGKILPPTTAIDCRPPRQTVAAHHGKRLPTPTANGCRPARQMVAAHDGKRLPTRAANGFRGPRQMVADNGKTRGRELSPSEVLGSTPPQDRRAWERKLSKLYPRELEALKADLMKQRVRLPLNDPAAADLSERIEAIELQLYGGKVEKRPATAVARPTRKAPEEKPMTEDALLESARAAVELGVPKTLTNAQREALRRAGELATK